MQRRPSEQFDLAQTEARRPMPARKGAPAARGKDRLAPGWRGRPRRTRMEAGFARAWARQVDHALLRSAFSTSATKAPSERLSPVRKGQLRALWAPKSTRSSQLVRIAEPFGTPVGDRDQGAVAVPRGDPSEPEGPARPPCPPPATATGAKVQQVHEVGVACVAGEVRPVGPPALPRGWRKPPVRSHVTIAANPVQAASEARRSSASRVLRGEGVPRAEGPAPPEMMAPGDRKEILGLSA